MLRPDHSFVRFLAELRRRRVYRVAVAYAIVGWVTIQVASDVVPALHLPEWATTLVVVLALLGFPVALVLAWAYDINPSGVERTLPPAGTAAAPPRVAADALSAGAASGDRAGRARMTSRIAVSGAVAVLGLAGVAFFASRAADPARQSDATDSTAARTVAVLPFHVRGSERVGYLSEGIVDLLTTDFVRESGVDAVDPNTLLAGLAGRDNTLFDAERGRDVAAEFGAGLYVVGNVFEVEGRVRLTAYLHDRSRGNRAVAVKTVEGGVADVLSLVARLAAELAAAVPAERRGLTARLVWTGKDVDVLGSPTADGRLLSFTEWETGDLAVRDLDASVNRRITGKGDWGTSDEYAEFSRISHDGRQIAYAWFNIGFEYDLRVIDTGGGAPRTLLSADWLAPYGWKRDGRTVLVDAWSEGSGRLVWVANDGSVSVIRATDHGEGPFALSPDEQWIAFDKPTPQDPARRNIHVVAADGSATDVLVRGPGRNQLLGWTPTGRHLLFWSDRGATPAVWALPIAGGRPAGPPALVRADMEVLRGFGVYGQELLYAVTASERQVRIMEIDVEQAAVLDGPTQIAYGTPRVSATPLWSPDGNRLAYASTLPGTARGRDARVIARDLATGAVTEYALRLENPRLVQWIGADTVVLYASDAGGRWGYYALSLATGAVSRHEHAGLEGIRFILVSRDGRALFFVRWRPPGAQLIRRDARSGRETVLFSHESGGIVYTLSPDEQLIALAVFSRAQGRHELHTVPAAGGPSRMEQFVPAPNVLPNAFTSIAWSSDGRHIVYARDTHDHAELRRLRLRDGDDRLLTTVSGLNAAGIRVHPDGRRVVFTAGESRQEIWALELPPEFLR
jgi:Tol biopolymer transport system component/TolB-like protein